MQRSSLYRCDSWANWRDTCSSSHRRCSRDLIATRWRKRREVCRLRREKVSDKVVPSSILSTTSATPQSPWSWLGSDCTCHLWSLEMSYTSMMEISPRVPASLTQPNTSSYAERNRETGLGGMWEVIKGEGARHEFHAFLRVLMRAEA